MTDREAIEYAYRHMDECICKIKSVNDYALICVLEKRKEFMMQSIEAFQEREERSRGCKWCNSGSFAPVLHVDENSQLGQMDVEFCPMCGRPLKGADNG